MRPALDTRCLCHVERWRWWNASVAPILILSCGAIERIRIGPAGGRIIVWMPCLFILLNALRRKWSGTNHFKEPIPSCSDSCRYRWPMVQCRDRQSGLK